MPAATPGRTVQRRRVIGMPPDGHTHEQLHNPRQIHRRRLHHAFTSRGNGPRSAQVQTVGNRRAFRPVNGPQALRQPEYSGFQMSRPSAWRPRTALRPAGFAARIGPANKPSTFVRRGEQRCISPSNSRMISHCEFWAPSRPVNDGAPPSAQDQPSAAIEVG